AVVRRAGDRRAAPGGAAVGRPADPGPGRVLGRGHGRRRLPLLQVLAEEPRARAGRGPLEAETVMADALIGSTGFVAANLLRQARFDDLYHHRNIADIRGRRYDTVVCAGARAEKWKANQAPEADREGIRALTDALEHVAARRFILISTVDVYPQP